MGRQLLKSIITQLEMSKSVQIRTTQLLNDDGYQSKNFKYISQILIINQYIEDVT